MCLWHEWKGWDLAAAVEINIWKDVSNVLWNVFLLFFCMNLLALLVVVKVNNGFMFGHRLAFCLWRQRQKKWNEVGRRFFWMLLVSGADSLGIRRHWNTVFYRRGPHRHSRVYISDGLLGGGSYLGWIKALWACIHAGDLCRECLLTRYSSARTQLFAFQVPSCNQGDKWLSIIFNC